MSCHVCLFDRLWYGDIRNYSKDFAEIWYRIFFLEQLIVYTYLMHCLPYTIFPNIFSFRDFLTSDFDNEGSTPGVRNLSKITDLIFVTDFLKEFFNRVF